MTHERQRVARTTRPRHPNPRFGSSGVRERMEELEDLEERVETERVSLSFSSASGWVTATVVMISIVGSTMLVGSSATIVAC